MQCSRPNLRIVWLSIAGSALVLALVGCVSREVRSRADYQEVTLQLESLIRREMTEKGLPALSIALVDDQKTVWAAGFGFADPEERKRATAQTVYRVGSVSKLFTDLAVMQLVERGQLDLDAPIERYLPDFRPISSFEKPITLRALMSHQAGLVREPPAGHYFAPGEPSLEATVSSLNRTELLYEPGSLSKYSNAGIAAVGYVLERTQHQSFPAYLNSSVLVPLRMKRSSFEPRVDLVRDLAKGVMWTYDGRIFDAPTFELGMAPAGSMYSTVSDLAAFISALFAGGRGVVKEDTLSSMWTPQGSVSAATPEVRRSFGIGFVLSEFEGRRRVGHGGAIYGFATSLAALPDEKLGVIVVTTRDSANAVTNRIAEAALTRMLAVREGRPLPVLPSTMALTREEISTFAGNFRSGTKRADLIASGGKLVLTRSGSDVRLNLRRRGDVLVTDDVLHYGLEVTPRTDAIVIEGESYRRIAQDKPAPAPPQLADLIGEYGWDHNVLYVYEHGGVLHALIEWFTAYPLAQESAHVFRFPDWGLYSDERLTFRRDIGGNVTEVEAGGVVFRRRNVGPDGGTFRITPQRAVGELRKEAVAARPPGHAKESREADLVEVTALDPTIKLDVRYATRDNFLSTPLYAEPRAYLQRPAAEALVRVHRGLRRHGYGLLIHDAYRPWWVTKVFWEATPAKLRQFVADPAVGSRHNRGCAVDLTLYDLRTGSPVRMPGVYDEMSDRSYPGYPGGTALQRWHRDLLRSAMEREGFTVYETEWWHFDFHAWREYPLLNLNLEQLAAGR